MTGKKGMKKKSKPEWKVPVVEPGLTARELEFAWICFASAAYIALVRRSSFDHGDSQVRDAASLGAYYADAMVDEMVSRSRKNSRSKAKRKVKR